MVAELPGGPELTKPVRKDKKTEQSKMNMILTAQMQNDENRRTLEKEDQLLKERQYLEALAMEVDLQYTADRVTALQHQSSLLEAWEREGHIRNLKKIHKNGSGAVKTYLERNVGELPSSARTMREMSVGFDPRQSKK